MTPIVGDADAFDDQRFTVDHPDRRYRRRPGPDGSVWLIRRLGRAYLRALGRAGIAFLDTDDALRVAWFEAAWPELDKPTRDKLIAAARKAERGTKAKKRAMSGATGRSRAASADHRPRGLP